MAPVTTESEPRFPARHRAWTSMLILLVLILGTTGCGEEDKPYEGPPIVTPELPTYRYPMQIAEESELLVDQDGKPVLVNGDAGWSLISSTTRSDMELYLDDRAARGFNSILLLLIDHIDPLVNAYGEPPFSVPGDFGTPNEAYFAYADEVIAAANERNIQVWLFPIYLGYRGGDEGFYQDMIATDAAEMRAWGRWVGERYGDVDGLVWVIGGDYTPPAEGLALIGEVQAGIAEFDTRHIFTAHWSGDDSGLEVGVDWVDLNNTYTYRPVYLKALEDYQTRRRPFILIESVYENGYDAPTSQIRAEAYYALLSGAKGHIYGHADLWQFLGNWKQTLDSPGAVAMMHLRGLFEEIAWTTLAPDVDGEVITSGKGSWGSWDYALLAHDDAGTLALAYVPTPRGLVLDLSQMAGPCAAQWFDPTDGSTHPVEGSPLPAQAEVALAAIGDNHDGDGDWLLLLQVEE